MKAFNGCNVFSGFTAEKSINYDQFMKTKKGDQEENIPALPNDFSLKQNYPNPFNPTTVIEYAVPKTVLVRLTIYDELGREVIQLVNEEKPAGRYHVSFDASRYASGVYFYRLEAGEFALTKKLLFVK